MPAGTRCCCNCTQVENEWEDVSSIYTFEKSIGISNSNCTALAHVDQYSSYDPGDGTTLGCKKYVLSTDLTTPVTARQPPCIEAAFTLDFMVPFDSLGYGVYWFGQILPGFVIYPNGKKFFLSWSIDMATQYYTVETSAQGVHTRIDAATNTAYLNGSSTNHPEQGFGYTHLNPVLVAEQCGQVYFYSNGLNTPSHAGQWAAPFKIEGKHGLAYSFGTDQSVDDWMRRAWLGGTNATDITNSTSWVKWIGDGIPFDPIATNLFTTIWAQSQLDWRAGAEPVKFGWSLYGQYAQQNINYFVQEVGRLRLDRLCLNLSQTSDAAPNLSNPDCSS